MAKQMVLVTGGAGFIGYHLTKKLLSAGYQVTAIDNMNDYYDPKLKEDRIRDIGDHGEDYTFVKGDIASKADVEAVFEKAHPDIVINLAAQAGVRYSIDHPDSYIQSNIIGFYHILEACRHHPVKHLLFASSSSVYGNQKKAPFSTTDFVDHPISLYAATKKSDELMAYTYSHLYGIPSTGLRFFTVYGPFGRPDMAYFKFTNKMVKGETIQVYNNGDMLRDFTYVDDITGGIMRMLEHPPVPNEDGDRYKIYNIGNNHPVKLMKFIEILEHAIGIEAKKEFLPMQPGDVYQTYADISELEKDFHFKPVTSLEEGLGKFAAWYKAYYHVK
jgi:UDP-glucuronate 4-epimerase